MKVISVRKFGQACDVSADKISDLIQVCVAGKPATLQLPTRILRLESGVGRIGESHFCFVALLGADKITG